MTTDCTSVTIIPELDRKAERDHFDTLSRIWDHNMHAVLPLALFTQYDGKRLSI